MYHNRFSVRVVGGNERDNGYVSMAHGRDYRLALRNDRALPCDAAVHVDGKHIGTWRIEAHSTITIERPSDDHGRLTFFKAGTAEAAAAGLEKGNPDLGLVSATFTPGQQMFFYSRPLQPKRWRPEPWIVPVPYQPYYEPHCVTGTTTTSNGGSYTVRATGLPEICHNPVDTVFNYTAAAQSATQCNTMAVNCSVAVEAGGTGLSGYSHQEFGTAAPINYDLSQQVTINLRLVSTGEVAAVRPLQASATPVPPPVE